MKIIEHFGKIHTKLGSIQKSVDKLESSQEVIKSTLQPIKSDYDRRMQLKRDIKKFLMGVAIPIVAGIVYKLIW